MKILGIVVVYNPNIVDLRKNILTYIDDIETLIIWQNTILSEKDRLILGFNQSIESKIIYMGEGMNVGIAYALNQAYKLMFKDNKYSHLLTMDQDSTWDNFYDYICKIKDCSKDIAIFSPNINYEYLSNIKSFIKVKTCITSGAIFPKEVLKSIGKFNEVYSVDCVDYDFSFKAAEKGIDILKVSEGNLIQIYGVPRYSNYFKLNTNEYSSKRLFFIARNHILLWRDYPKHIDSSFRKMILSSHIFGKIIKVILIEKDKFSKIVSILHGFYKGVINNRKDIY